MAVMDQPLTATQLRIEFSRFRADLYWHVGLLLMVWTLANLAVLAAVLSR